MTDKPTDPAPKRRLPYTEADLRRAMRAAKKEGFRRVELTATPEGLKIVAALGLDPADPVEGHVAHLD